MFCEVSSPPASYACLSASDNGRNAAGSICSALIAPSKSLASSSATTPRKMISLLMLSIALRNAFSRTRREFVDEI
jgi:hypothetical protein